MERRRKMSIGATGLVLGLCWIVDAGAEPREAIVEQFAALAGRAPDAAAGERLWTREGVRGRYCASCHGPDLTRAGRHQRTGKSIAPMAPSVNPDRYTDPKKVAKWLKRNCKWTFGRDCTPGEKADVLHWLSNL
ncbi:MAG: DUF1924 domain-containing protein [Gammaproteobacteria bacterium]|nr:MAG: DUF1924 domain-containing protein [Gammaproteobacteria bacterium]